MILGVRSNALSYHILNVIVAHLTEKDFLERSIRLRGIVVAFEFEFVSGEWRADNMDNFAFDGTVGFRNEYRPMRRGVTLLIDEQKDLTRHNCDSSKGKEKVLMEWGYSSIEGI